MSPILLLIRSLLLGRWIASRESCWTTCTTPRAARRVGCTPTCRGHPDCLQLPGLFAQVRQTWVNYRDRVERSIRGEDEHHTVHTVFGVCRRCSSSRLLVTTRQLRRADEGMHGGCGIATPASDGDPPMQGLRACNQGQQLTRHEPSDKTNPSHACYLPTLSNPRRDLVFAPVFLAARARPRHKPRTNAWLTPRRAWHGRSVSQRASPKNLARHVHLDTGAAPPGGAAGGRTEHRLDDVLPWC